MNISKDMLEILPQIDIRMPKWDMLTLQQHLWCPLSLKPVTSSLFRRPDGLPVSYCSETGVWFCSERPQIKQLLDFYNSYWASHLSIKFDAALARQLKYGLPKYDLRNIIFKKILAVLGNISGKKLLDVGMGTGVFVAHAKKIGFECYGLDVAEDAVKFLTDTLDVKCFAGNLETWNSHERFDVITLLDVIEHPLNPMDVLNAARRLLTEKGILVLWTPNGGQAGDNISTARNWTGFRVDLEHMQYFSNRTIVWLSKQLNMDILHLEAIGYPGSQGSDIATKSKYYSIRRKLGDHFPFIRNLRQGFINSVGASVDHRLGQYHLFAVLRAR